MKLFGREKPRRAPQVRERSSRTDAEAEPKPPPQPERQEPPLEDPSLRDLSRRDYLAIVVRAAKESIEDAILDSAAAVAYYSFLAIPTALLIAVGAFSLFAGPDAIRTVIEKAGAVMPAEAVTLLEDSLRRMAAREGGFTMIVVGAGVGLWTTTSAMSALIRALNTAYDRDESRGFLRQRLTALVILVAMFFAFVLVFGLLVLGPALSTWLGEALDLESTFEWLWWTLQWPILILALLFVFATILYFGPNVDHPRWQFITPGAVFAVVIWLAASGGFAIYVSLFGSYDKTWGSLAAVIIMLTWLWLSALALLFGAEVNSEAERSRELRSGEPAEHRLTAPAKASRARG